MCGDCGVNYWHIRGKHLTAQRLSAAFLQAGGGGRTRARAAALAQKRAEQHRLTVGRRERIRLRSGPRGNRTRHCTCGVQLSVRVDL
jgi:hypothetical protein